MKKSSSLVVILILLTVCVMISSCQTGKSFVFSSDCVAPCWRHIQPGRTTEKEANDLVAGFSDIKGDNVWRGGLESIAQYIEFDLSSGVNVRIYLMDKVVALIKFVDPSGIITFGDCVQEFGVPEFAVQSSVMGYGLPIGATSAWHTWFYALNTDKGTAYGYDTYGYFGKNAVLAPKTRVMVIEFYDVDSFEKLLKDEFLINVEVTKNLTTGNLNSWNGYGDIDKLYPEK